LIQYQPTTTEVYRRPLVIIPPWINKYYILDLREKNSFIKWATDQGHTVFVVSWVNPDARLAQKGFEDYMLEGSLAALDAVQRATGEQKVNVIGYCLGGTLLGCALSHLAATGDARIGCSTFFVSLLDFSAPGELGVFIDEQQVQSLEKKMNERGYLEGSEMASTFNILRANDLVWSFVINNYLLGKDPFPFDLLYWNSDSTRMPAKMHSFYLRNMYLKNLLGVAGGITLAGEPVDLQKVLAPAYFISTVEDHIAPWKTTYRGARYLGGPVRFVLGGSGHIAGIVNPPAAKKYHFWTSDALPETAEQWFDGATQRPGSWWEDWQAWIDARRSHDAGAQVLIQNALGRMRVGLESTDAPWLSRFDEAMRRAHRELGRRLLQEVAHAASAPGLTDAVRSAADDIGREYAALSLGEVMPLVEAIRAFLFFRDNIVDSIIQMSGALEPIAAPSWLTMHRQICAFLNEVLFALVRAYAENRSA